MGLDGRIGVVFWPIILAIIGGVVWFVRSTPPTNNQAFVNRRSPDLEALEERYARGEISREDYLQKKRDRAD